MGACKRRIQNGGTRFCHGASRWRLASCGDHVATVHERSPKEIFAQLGLSGQAMDWAALEKFADITPGTKVGTATPIFPRLDVKEEVEAIVDMMRQASAARVEEEEVEEEDEDIRPETTIDVFDQIELRVGEVVTAEKIKKAKKLLKLQVDMAKKHAKSSLVSLSGMSRKI